jgi:hypothetical protein
MVAPPIVAPAADVPPVALPPVALPPIALPPVALPPVALPPVALPPVALPPVALPPVAFPPAALPPVALPLPGFAEVPPQPASASQAAKLHALPEKRWFSAVPRLKLMVGYCSWSQISSSIGSLTWSAAVVRVGNGGGGQGWQGRLPVSVSPFHEKKWQLKPSASKNQL